MSFYSKSPKVNRLIGIILFIIGALGLATNEMLQKLNMSHAHTWQDFTFGFMIGIGVGFFAVSYTSEMNSANRAEEQNRKADEV